MRPPLVLNHTVDIDGNSTAGVRWAELRNTGSGWFLHQAGTFAPDDRKHRWMGSIAMDGAGNIALGYSISSKGMFPSIAYVTRSAGDPLGTMPGGEELLYNGSGSQIGSGNRWGDYSSMSVDPVDDCTFWYTQEYYANVASFDFKTRIGFFKFPDCGGPVNQPPTVNISQPGDGSPPFVSGLPIAFVGSASDTEDGDLTADLDWTSDNDGPIGSGGNFSATLSDGSHTITASVTDSGGKSGSDSVSITVGVCTQVGDPCSSNDQCCSNKCKGKPSAKTCK